MAMKKGGLGKGMEFFFEGKEEDVSKVDAAAVGTDGDADMKKSADTKASAKKDIGASKSADSAKSYIEFTTTGKELESPTGRLLDMPLDMIIPNPDQPRRYFNDEDLAELADSIKNVGVIQPILVYRQGDKYIIGAGERRYRASKMLGLKSIPVIIRENLDEQLKHELSLIENLQREDLNPIEIAESINELVERYKQTHEQVAKAIGKTRPVVTNYLRLLVLPDEVKTMIIEKKLSAGHARCLVAIDDREVIIKFAEMAVLSKLSVRDLELRVRLYFSRKAIPDDKKGRQPQTRELKAFVTDMKSIFSTKVKIVGNDNRGRIFIDYFSSDDLQRIYDLIHKIKD